jgi:hypothetical protein
MSRTFQQRAQQLSEMMEEQSVMCDCGLPALLKQVMKNGPTHGKSFLGCGTGRMDGCKFFKWCTPEGAPLEAIKNAAGNFKRKATQFGTKAKASFNDCMGGNDSDEDLDVQERQPKRALPVKEDQSAKRTQEFALQLLKDRLERLESDLEVVKSGYSNGHTELLDQFVPLLERLEKAISNAECKQTKP